MFGARRTRTLLGPADPARRMPPEPPRLSAAELIAWAEATAEPNTPRRGVRRDARLPRRMVLATGAVTLAAGAVAVIGASGVLVDVERGPADPPGTAAGRVLVPVAYQPGTDEAAGPRLRALADGLVDAAYESSAGRYTYHRKQVWGDPVMTSPDGRFSVAFSQETKVWWTPGEPGRQTTVMGVPEYPDQASRDHWASRQPVSATASADAIPLPPFEPAALPSTRRELARMLKTELGAAAVGKETSKIFGRYAVPRAIRAEVLRVLADVPGFRWRGEVTDRAGRAGLAVTFDDREHGQQHLLIFHPRTGELLASELLTLGPVRMNAYELILETGRTDRLG
ncbi:CU044_5270 family protein [Catellatospora aurea]|uniref:CU044_5270 family protein n=1 Tax=Catellatospora aurea TaxID=1337874 RepID=A0ABW2GQQ4_9ACTN